MEQKEINASLLHHINTAMRRIEYLEQRLAATEQRLIDYDRALELPHNAGELAQARRRIALNQKARVIRDDSKRIALALHFILVRDVAAYIMYNNGILSQSKVQGLTSWSTQYAVDYCLVHGVSDILRDGIYDPDLLEQYAGSPQEVKVILDYLAEKRHDTWLSLETSDAKPDNDESALDEPEETV